MLRPISRSHSTQQTYATGHLTIISPSPELIDVDGTGKGTRATTAIKVGILLVAEPPLFPAPKSPISVQDLEGYIPLELEKLDENEQRAFFELRNSWGKPKSTIQGIWETNAMPVKGSRSGIFPVCSRFNHSCSANAAYGWKNDLGLQMIYYTKDIQAEEEICVGYFGREMTRLPTDE